MSVSGTETRVDKQLCGMWEDHLCAGEAGGILYTMYVHVCHCAQVSFILSVRSCIKQAALLPIYMHVENC